MKNQSVSLGHQNRFEVLNTGNFGVVLEKALDEINANISSNSKTDLF